MDQFFHIFLCMHLIDLLCCESWALVLFYSSLKQLRIQTSRVVCAFKYFAYQPRTGWAQKWVHRLMTIILSNLNRLKFFFHWKTPPHLKYVATLPCNLSLMACFADINVSRGSVATYARHSVIFNIHLTTNLSMNLPVNFFSNRFRFDWIMVESLWPHFFRPTLYVIAFAGYWHYCTYKFACMQDFVVWLNFLCLHVVQACDHGIIVF